MTARFNVPKGRVWTAKDDSVKPMPEARYAVFYSLADGGDGGRYYDVHRMRTCATR